MRKLLKKIIKSTIGMKNVNSLIHSVYFIPNALCNLFPMRKRIVFESHPDFSDNTYAVFKEIIQNPFFKDYEFVWIVESCDLKKHNNFNIRVQYLDISPNGFIDKIYKYFICNRAKIIITCNRPYKRFKTSSEQLNIYLDHGSPLKDMMRNDTSVDISCDYIISQSSFFHKYLVSQYGINEGQIWLTGFPRNDQLFKKNTSIRKLIPSIDLFNKVIIWMPTFRRIKNNGRIDCKSELPLDLPILYNVKLIEELDAQLKMSNILMLIKPHPAQDLSAFDEMNCTNIRVLSNQILINLDIQTNELLSQTDALITDYSSVYYDYLLLNRPIAITLDDYTDYLNQKGFVFDDFFSVIKGEYLYTFNDLCDFIKNISQNVDRCVVERNEAKIKTNQFSDSCSSKRVVSKIIEMIKGE